MNCSIVMAFLSCCPGDDGLFSGDSGAAMILKRPKDGNVQADNGGMDPRFVVDGVPPQMHIDGGDW